MGIRLDGLWIRGTRESGVGLRLGGLWTSGLKAVDLAEDRHGLGEDIDHALAVVSLRRHLWVLVEDLPQCRGRGCLRVVCHRSGWIPGPMWTGSDQSHLMDGIRLSRGIPK